MHIIHFTSVLIWKYLFLHLLCYIFSHFHIQVLSSNTQEHDECRLWYRLIFSPICILIKIKYFSWLEKNFFSKKTPVSCTTNYLCLNIHSIDSFTVDTLNKVFTWQQYRHMPAVLFRNIQLHYLFSSQINASKFHLISHSCSGKNSNWLTAQQNADTKLLINKLINK